VDEGADRARQAGAVFRTPRRRTLTYLERGFARRHEQQQATTRRLLSAAREKDNLRLVEVLERDEHSLARILEGLDAIETDHADREELDLRDLAAPDDEEDA
jgi:hypothetical protein